MVINQEADEIAYRCAFACQKQGYIWKGRTERDLGSQFTRTEIKNFMKAKGKEEGIDYELLAYNIVEPEYIVDYTLDRMVEKLYGLQIPGVVDKVTEVKLWLSPSDHSNFRYGVSNIPGSKGQGYKAGRPAKPYHLSYIRSRLTSKWGAQQVIGYEADDALGMYQTENTIASHIDKDINMIPGKHYNHVEGNFYTVPEGLGFLTYNNSKLKGLGTVFFYAQLLTGDATDNIPGIAKLGPKKAYDILNEVSSEDDCFAEVYRMYKNYYGADQAQEAIEEISDLLWIVRADKLTGRQYLKSKGYIS